MIEIKRGNRTIRIADRHSVYRNDLENHFEEYWKTVIPEREGDLEVEDFSCRRVHRFSDGLKLELNAFPETYEDTLRYWPKGKKCQLAFEIGANCGVGAFRLLEVAEMVIAVEPDKENFDCLCSNIKRHRMASRIITVPYAVSGSHGAVSFSSEGAIGSGIPSFTGRSVDRAEEVRSVTISWLAMTTGIPDIVKIDVEGAEIGILDRCPSWLVHNHPYLAIDTSHWNSKTKTMGTSPDCEEILRYCGYKVHSVDGMTWGWV
jgi:FkbM family methyltransferase